MPIESSVSQISDLNASYPDNADNMNYGAAHVRYLKTAVKSLNASGGAAQIGYIGAGTGAVARTVQAAHRDIANLKDFGAVMDGTTSDNAAMALAVAAVNASQITMLYVPRGTTKLTGAHAVNVNNFSMHGEGARSSLIKQTTDGVNTFTFTSTTPNTNRSDSVSMHNIGIDLSSITAPTSGCAITLVRPGRTRLTNVDIFGGFQALNVQGGADLYIDNFTAYGSQSWSGVASGSYLVNFEIHSGSGEVPSEIFVCNSNIKGADSTSYLDKAVNISAGDGLFFSNCHIGFANDSALAITPVNNASAYIVQCMFNNVYFDGAYNGSASRGAVAISGSSTPSVEGIMFNACTMAIHDGAGIFSSLSTLKDLQIHNCNIVENGCEAIKLTAGTGVSITGNTIRRNNNSGGAKKAIDLAGVSSFTIVGNNILAGNTAHPVGIIVDATCSGGVISRNTMAGHTLNVSVSSSASNVVWDRSSAVLLTATGFTTSPTCTVYYQAENNNCTLNIVGGISATSNSTSFTLTGLPAEVWPARTQNFICRTKDNGGAYVASIAVLDTSGVLTFAKDITGAAFTNSGTKGVSDITISYNLA